MVLPTGQISLADLRNEYGGSNPAYFSQYYAGGALVPLGATNIPSSGSLDLNAYRGRNLAPNYVTVGLYTVTNPKFGYTIEYYGWDTGVLAQDVEKVLPEIVKAAPFDLDENNQSKSGENYKTLQYDKLVPLLVEAIKEQQKIIDS